jgi:hypothetical protein
MKPMKKCSTHAAETPILLDGDDLAPVNGGAVLAPGQEPRRRPEPCTPEGQAIFRNVVMA